MQPALRKYVQPRGSGRGSKARGQLFSSIKRMAEAEAGGKAAGEVSLLLITMLRYSHQNKEPLYENNTRPGFITGI